MPEEPFSLFSINTLHELLDERARRDPEQIFVITPERSWSYADIAVLSNSVAGRLSAMGMESGDRVMVVAQTSPLYLALWFAISRIGAIEVPVNPEYKGPHLRQFVETAAPVLCVVADEFRNVVESACKEQFSDEQLYSFEYLFSDSAEQGTAISTTVSRRNASALIFTSGTTGRSKAVMMSHSHQLSFGFAFAEIVYLQKTDISYNFLPFFHVAARFVTIGTVIAGGSMFLCSHFSVSKFWDDVRTYGITVCVAVGGLCYMLNGQAHLPDDRKNLLRVIYAVPVPWEFKDKFEARFNVSLIEGYGGTECNLVAYSRLEDSTPIGSCGRASPHFEIQIQDENGGAKALGEAGEICVRPKIPGTMMTGYFGQPEQTLEVTADLWFHTGDRGYIDAQGYLFFLDRIKDAIRRRGENISSFEVERVLNAFGPVAESAVIPVPSEIGEDEVKAVIVLKTPGSVSEEDIFRYATENMPYFMVPRFIEIRNDLPRTPTLKIKKTALREEGNTSPAWDRNGAGLHVDRNGLITRLRARKS